MTPFMQFRLWTREGPGTERVLALVAAVLVTALVGWGLVPDHRGEQSVVAGAAAAGDQPAAAGPAPSGAPTVAATPAGAAPVATPTPTAVGSTSSGPTAAASSPTAAAANGCDNRATDVGITDKEILIGVVIYTVGDANPALGIPPAEDTMKMYNTLFGQINAKGGVQCRRLVAKFYEDFVLSSESGHSACLKMQEDKVFAVMNNLNRVENRNCVPQAKIPNFWATSADTATVRQFAPYVLSFQADYDRLMRDYAHGAKAKGFFDGMGKLGLLEQTCYPDRVKVLRASLGEVGIGSDRISTYNVGCPAVTATPDQMTAAALQFRRDGVTNVMSAYREWAMPFTQAADQQAFKPKYAFVDDQFSSLASNANPPWPASFDGALGIEKSQEGAEYTPGSAMSPATADCTAVTKAAGLPAPTDTGTLAGSLHALACINTKMLQAAAAHTYPLTRIGLAKGLAQAGKLDLSFPAGPSNFTNPAFPIGAQFWRASVYKADCSCVQLLDPVWKPEF